MIYTLFLTHAIFRIKCIVTALSMMDTLNTTINFTAAGKETSSSYGAVELM